MKGTISAIKGDDQKCIFELEDVYRSSPLMAQARGSEYR